MPNSMKGDAGFDVD